MMILNPKYGLINTFFLDAYFLATMYDAFDILGQAAHPLAPGTFLSGNECVQDAKELMIALKSHELPDGLPDALTSYSSMSSS